MSQHLELFAALAAPFEAEAVRLRTQAGRQLQYITARTVMNRLDDVLGPENWWDEYQPLEHSVICRLTIKLPDGTILTKSDAGGYAGMPDSGDDEKSGFSDAFKRAAVKFGIGRYLYRDGVPRFLQEHGRHASAPVPSPIAAGSTADGQSTVHGPLPARRDTLHAAPARSSGDGQNTPQSGKALFAWTKQQDEKFGLDLLKTLSDWAKLRDFPAKMIHWSPEQVQLAYAEASSVMQESHAPALDASQNPNGTANGRDHTPDLSSRETAPKERPASTVPPSAATPRKDREPAQPRAARTR